MASGHGPAADFSATTSRERHVHIGVRCVRPGAGTGVPGHGLEGDVLDLEPRYKLVHRDVRSVQIMAEHACSHELECGTVVEGAAHGHRWRPPSLLEVPEPQVPFIEALS